jgi:hypothetical protein
MNPMIQLTVVVAALVVVLGIVLGAVITEFAASASLAYPAKPVDRKGPQAVPRRLAPGRPDSLPAPVRAREIEWS